MGYISKMFEKASVSQISDFLMYGTAEVEANHDTCVKRQREADEKIEKMVIEKFPDRDEQDRILDIIYDYITTSEQLIHEVGMCCGASLVIQLITQNRDKDTLESLQAVRNNKRINCS